MSQSQFNSTIAGFLLYKVPITTKSDMLIGRNIGRDTHTRIYLINIPTQNKNNKRGK
uniref:Uncharacterized protein n=1 Tax=Octopus bimaculoides TaxID=37653 RepID=A0A0L8HWK0_OCTBM